MKRVAAIFSLLIGTLSAASAATIEARHTHGVFYPGLEDQAVLQLKVTGKPGEKIKELKFSLGESTTKGKIKAAKLSSSGNRNSFTLHTQNPVQ